MIKMGENKMKKNKIKVESDAHVELNAVEYFTLNIGVQATLERAKKAVEEGYNITAIAFMEYAQSLISTMLKTVVPPEGVIRAALATGHSVQLVEDDESRRIEISGGLFEELVKIGGEPEVDEEEAEEGGEEE